MSGIAALLETEALSPHGVCLLWRSDLIWLHLVSDVLTGLAYWSILAVLMIVAMRRRGLLYPWAVELFAAFILLCGATHFMAAWTLWHPGYGVQGMLKAATAVVSVVTAIVIWPLLPRILALPSVQALAEANASLRREIGERREAEHRARYSEARLAGFFEHIPDALFVVRAEPEGCILETVNPSFCRLFRAPREALEGISPERLLEPEAAAELARQFAACLATGAPRDWESTMPALEDIGQVTRHWHTVLVPLPGTEGEPPRLLGSLRDVTQLRRLQADLVEAARRATIGAMCAGVAHEMSQPVNIIGLWTERARAALEQGIGTPRRALEVVLDQTRRLGTLLERMRELARDAPGATEVFDAAATAAATVEVAQRAWQLERIEVVLEPVGATTVPVRGRAAQLEQALLHLLENARDAVTRRRLLEPDAPGRITVSLTTGAEPGSAVIAVRDTGGGVPAAIAAHILDPFVTSKDPGQGTGLGLPIAAGLLRGMGGRIAWTNWAEGRPDAGAVFRMTLPLARTVSGPVA
ncbi:hybrid sensor histidine kinase/response regulator [Siccirubricoccus deserti]|uniref:histidine kinase n=1 Tax=Siccirubricoccus deserti TaxID=2013562 RepID=A0A9X0UDP5_9PROT|nr:ATP-binding protein [Siccirubricoccus deserti]MBC4016809.1 PAS domain-containing protein [Siccirubricoccus deserti]GGC52075.1 hybrid sensor histidine kinase/response regulator [Siccirubricoccus deserti]